MDDGLNYEAMAQKIYSLQQNRIELDLAYDILNSKGTDSTYFDFTPRNSQLIKILKQIRILSPVVFLHSDDEQLCQSFVESLKLDKNSLPSLLFHFNPNLEEIPTSGKLAKKLREYQKESTFAKVA